MSDRTLVVRELNLATDRQLWNSFVAQTHEGDFYQAWEWGIIKSPNWRALRLGVFRNQTLVAGVAIQHKKLPIVGSIYYAPRGPLLIDWSDTESLALLLNEITQHAKRDRVAFLKVNPAIALERAATMNLLQQHGFTPAADLDQAGFGGVVARCNMRVELAGRTVEEIHNSFGKKTRRYIRLAHTKYGVEIINAPARQDLEVFNQLMQTTGERQGFLPYPLSFYQDIWDNFGPDQCKLFLVRYQDKYLSGCLLLKIGNRAFGLCAGSANEYREVYPNYAMYWAMIQWAKEQDCIWCDFGGVSPRPRSAGMTWEQLQKQDQLQGLNVFKEAFSPQLIEYIGEYDRVYRRWAYWIYAKGKPFAKRFTYKIGRIFERLKSRAD